MAYKKTIWVEGETPISPRNMNNIEEDIEAQEAALDAHKADSMPHKTADGGYRWGLRINPDKSATLIYEMI